MDPRPYRAKDPPLAGSRNRMNFAGNFIMTRTVLPEYPDRRHQ